MRCQTLPIFWDFWKSQLRGTRRHCVLLRAMIMRFSISSLIPKTEPQEYVPTSRNWCFMLLSTFCSFGSSSFCKVVCRNFALKFKGVTVISPEQIFKIFLTQSTPQNHLSFQPRSVDIYFCQEFSFSGTARSCIGH